MEEVEGGRAEEEVEEFPPLSPSPPLPNLAPPPFPPPTGLKVVLAAIEEAAVVLAGVVVGSVEERMALRTLFPPRSTSLRVFRGASEAVAAEGGKEESGDG